MSSKEVSRGAKVYAVRRGLKSPRVLGRESTSNLHQVTSSVLANFQTQISLILCLIAGPVSVEVSSDGGHTWTSDNVTYTYFGLRTVLDQPIRVPSVHCSAMSTVQELERAALRHSRGF